MMMNIANHQTHMMFDKLGRFRFMAGMTLRGPWRDEVDVYKFVEHDVAPPNTRVIIPIQVHGSVISHLGDAGLLSNFDADGVITRRENVSLTVTTADCMPILAADPISGYFAAIHVGWRSFVAGIIDNFFQIGRGLGMSFSRTRVFWGPSIGSCCFAVGPEVAALFDESWVENRNGVLYVDLKGAVQDRLISLGLVGENIGGFSDCTSCNPDRHYSYRRDKNSPVQMVTFIYRTA